MDYPRRKEEVSKSYLNAVCAVCGVSMEVHGHDDDGIDATLKKQVVRADGRDYIALISVQLKSTSSGYDEQSDYYAYPLKKKNYDDLRRPATAKSYLFVLILPNDESLWVKHSIEELVIKKCMFWLDLNKLPDRDNSSTVTVHIPKSNSVSPKTVERLLENAANEVDL